MKLYDFKLLPDKEQYYMVFNKGQFLDYYLEENKRFALYAVEIFLLNWNIMFNSTKL